MNFRNVLLAGAAFVTFGGLSTPASAITMQATYTGTLNSTTDDTGLFNNGTGAGVLDGLGFIMTYIYETSGYVSGLSDIGFGPIGNFNKVYGGTTSSPVQPMPILSATLTINGHSETIIGDNFGEALNFQYDAPIASPDFSAAYHQTIHKFDDGIIKVAKSATAGGQINSLAIPLGLETPFETDVSSSLGRTFALYQWHYVGLALVNDYAVVGNFAATHLKVSLASAVPPPEVPLPAALPLFAAGLSAMGFMGWRKKRKTAPVS